MANEIKFSARLAVTNGNDEQDLMRSGRINQAAQGSLFNMQEIGTTYEAIATGDIGTPGWCMLQNLDGTKSAVEEQECGAIGNPCR